MSEAASDASTALDAPAADAGLFTQAHGIALDPSFGSGGSLGGSLAVWTPVGVAIDPGGRILVSGPGNDSDLPPQEIVRRFTASGALDETFGESGHVTISVNADQWGQVLRGFPTGEVGVLGAGFADGGDEGFAIRLAPGSSADAAFSVALPVATFGWPFQTGLWADDGSGFVLGTEAVVRFDASGRVDSSFGSAGHVAGAQAGALRGDGKLWTGVGGLVARYLANGVPDGAFGHAGSVDLGWQEAGATIQCVLAAATGGALIIGSHVSEQKTFLDLASLGADGTADVAFTVPPSAPIADAPVGAARLAGLGFLVWTSGGDVVMIQPGGGIDGIWNLDLLGTVLAATLDAIGDLVVVGIVTADPTNSEWFLRRYMFL